MEENKEATQKAMEMLNGSDKQRKALDLIKQNCKLKEAYNEQVIIIEGLANERDLYSEQAKELQAELIEVKKALLLNHNWRWNNDSDYSNDQCYKINLKIINDLVGVSAGNGA